ncbi:hypothetical protein EHQ53_10360 [Leptospira langatensis]|uniref:Uncharacterized protein n=1 Tax=Leptospira langatensis TaxID=2484983 RepID=A0A5F1ZRZ9_9LEPT|nr:hypothetical protein EHO57_16140 [Leptospira langatensis]TGL40400.1 hypothetical protein EHQ53_10360 [Leptospira langatensis]
MEFSPKTRLRTHRYIGILSLLFLFLRPLADIFNYYNISPFALESIYLGRIGAIFGALAFFTGGGLGNYLSEEKSKLAEIHTIVILAGLLLQIPILAEAQSNFLLNSVSALGLVFLIVGWVLGRRVFPNRKRILPF